MNWINYVFADFYSVGAHIIMNPNAFPEHQKRTVNASIGKLALFFSARKDVPLAVAWSRNDFGQRLQERGDELKAIVRTRPDVTHRVSYEGIPYLAPLEMLLLQMKAFLDAFSPVICGLIAPTTKPVGGFNKAKVGGNEMIGGKLVLWLENQSPSKFAGRDEFVALVRHNVAGWMTEAVKYRDQLAHHGGIAGFRHMRLEQSSFEATPMLIAILDPELPNGMALDAYAGFVCDSLGRFIEASLNLLPSVDQTMLGTWEGAKRELRFS